MKYILFLGIIISCSTGNKPIEKNDNFKFSLPNSVVALENIKDKESIEYTIAAHRAILDIINIGKSSLATANSGLSLQYFTLGNNLFPYREDILAMKKIALDKYIEATSNLEANKDISCSLIKERVAFLENLAPDALSKIVHKRENCTFTPSKNQPFNINQIINLRTPSPSSSELRLDINLSKDYEYLKWRIDFFPKNELTMLYLKYLSGFKIISTKVTDTNIHRVGNETYFTLNAEYENFPNENTYSFSDLETEIKQNIYADQKLDLAHTLNFLPLTRLNNEKTELFLTEILLKPKMITGLLLKFNDGREITKKIILDPGTYGCLESWKYLFNKRSFFKRFLDFLVYPKFCDHDPDFTGRVYPKSQMNDVTLTIHRSKGELSLLLPENLMKDLKSFELYLDPQETFNYYAQDEWLKDKFRH